MNEALFSDLGQLATLTQSCGWMDTGHQTRSFVPHSAIDT